MKVEDVTRILEELAPPCLAEAGDSIGLQVGDPNAKVRGIAVGLDPIPKTIRGAKGCGLLVLHHPAIYNAVTSVVCGTPVGDAVREAIKNDLAIYVMHTNYDAAPDGINDALAEELRLREVRPLSARGSEREYKLVVFVPAEAVEVVRDAMAEAGAGIIGRYSHCSFRTQGIGSFRPMDGASPYVGKVGRLEEVNEWRLEMVVPESRNSEVIRAMTSAHPYEEVAYDLYALEEGGGTGGIGRIGRIPVITAEELLTLVRHRLKAPDARYHGPDGVVFERIAVCGGAGGSLLPEAAEARAEVYVTGEMGYHSRLLAEHLGLAVVEAGHRETELPGMRRLAARLRGRLKGEGIAVRFVG